MRVGSGADGEGVARQAGQGWPAPHSGQEAPIAEKRDILAVGDAAPE
jgi:hypothetical protein